MRQHGWFRPHVRGLTAISSTTLREGVGVVWLFTFDDEDGEEYFFAFDDLDLTEYFAIGAA